MQPSLIFNAQIATSKGVFSGAVEIEGGIIKALYKEDDKALAMLRQNLPQSQQLDAEGHYLLPGGVDPHTHFDLDAGIVRASDDFYTGSVAAACGGTTTVVDHMAFGPKGCGLTHQAKVYHELAQRCAIDYGLHGVIQHVNDDVLRDMQVMRDEEGISSFKIYMTYEYHLEDDAILKVLQRAKQLDVVVCSHCENHALITEGRKNLVAQGKTQPKWHPVSRAPEAEAEAAFRLIMLARTVGEPKVYVVHLSTQLGLETIRFARSQGQKNILAETCPQYLFLDDTAYQDDVQGLKYIMSPPLRKQADQQALWGGIAAGDIQTMGTDHCPFFLDPQKLAGAKNFTECPNGAPGVELRMPIMFSEGFMAGRITLPQLVSLCCSRPAEIFGFGARKGDIKPGADADLVLYDETAQWTVQKSLLHERVDYTPYEGMQLTGKPVLTLLRGNIIARNGEFCGQKGQGQYLRRNEKW